MARKQLLPTYDVFDEARYFTPDNRSGLARSIGNLTLGVTVCEDAWQSAGKTPSSYAQDPIEHIAEWCRQGVEIQATVNLSASPFHSEKANTRLEVARHAASVLNHPFLLANQVGGNDDLLFDGRSLVAWPDGRAVIAPSWQEGVLLVDLAGPEHCRWLPSHAEDALSIGQSGMIRLEAHQELGALHHPRIQNLELNQQSCEQGYGLHNHELHPHYFQKFLSTHQTSNYFLNHWKLMLHYHRNQSLQYDNAYQLFL